jgi:antitoxin CptB
MSHVGTAPGLQHDHAELRPKRPLFRCWHRDTQAIDLIFGSFTESAGGRLSTARLGRFEVLLDCDDTDLFDWVTGRSTAAADADGQVFAAAHAFLASPIGPKDREHQADDVGTQLTAITPRWMP